MSGAGNQLHFRGALALPEDGEPSLIVDLRVEDEVVVIMQDDEELGVWDVEQVDAERLNGQKFRLQLGEDEVIFHARDRAGFAYTGMNAISAAKERIEERRNKVWYERLLESGDPISVKALVADAREFVGRIGPALRSRKPAVPEAVSESITRREATSTSHIESERVRAVRPAVRAPRTEPASDRVETAQARPSEAPPATSIETPPRAQPEPKHVETMPGDAPSTESVPREATEPVHDGQLEDDIEPLEPWNLGPAAIPTTPTRRNRGRHRTGRSQSESVNPWAVVADDLLRKDPEPATPPKRRLLRGHEHDFTKTALSGGLVRLVCECGEVVIKSES